MQPLASGTRPANLFAAGKSYLMAMQRLEGYLLAGDQAPAMPFYFLAGFSIELTLKAVILSERKDESLLRRIGHRLEKCYLVAVQCGYAARDAQSVERLVNAMAPTHAAAAFRYVPDLETIVVPGPGIVIEVLGKMIDQIEDDFDVWEDGRRDAG